MKLLHQNSSIGAKLHLYKMEKMKKDEQYKLM